MRKNLNHVRGALSSMHNIEETDYMNGPTKNSLMSSLQPSEYEYQANNKDLFSK